MKKIFLTGATGFLGVHLVREFLNNKDISLYCLVRSESEKAARVKFMNSLERYGISITESEKSNIHLICGDLEKDNLGMERDTYDLLSRETDVVFHNAAWVNWLLPAELLGRVNILGTKRMLKFSNHNKNKKFYFVSSLSVFPFDGKNYMEKSSIDGDFSLYGGYAQSKWLAEMVVQKAISEGKDAIIFRPNLITGRSSDGTFSHSAFFENCLKSFIQLKCAPRLDKTYMAVVPVDYVSRGMVQAVSDDVQGRIFHFSNAGYAAITDIIKWIQNMGFSIEIAELNQWKHKLFADKDFYTNALYPFKPFVYGLEDGYMLMGKVYSEETDKYMRSRGIECPPIDEKLIKIYIDNFKSSSFL